MKVRLRFVGTSCLLGALLSIGCTPAERRSVIGGIGDAIGIVPVDFDPVVDSDGDGDPSNDVDNAAEIAARAAAELAGKATRGDWIGLVLSVVGMAGAGGAAYFVYRRRKRGG